LAAVTDRGTRIGNTGGGGGWIPGEHGDDGDGEEVVEDGLVVQADLPEEVQEPVVLQPLIDQPQLPDHLPQEQRRGRGGGPRPVGGGGGPHPKSPPS